MPRTPGGSIGSFQATIDEADVRTLAATGPNVELNLVVQDPAVAAVAVKHRCELAQVALAWVYAQAERLGVSVVPIPGTKRRTWLEQNVAALDIHLDADDLAALDPLAGQVAGSRY